MKDGELLQVGDPQSLYNHPANSFIANFTGAEAVLTGVIERTNDGRTVVKLMGSDREIKHIDDPQLAKAERVKISVRPENVSLDRMSDRKSTRLNSSH